MQHNTQVPVGKYNNRQHASPHNEVATDVKQMPIRPIIILLLLLYWIHPVCLSVSVLTFRVRLVASTVLDGFFPYLVQIINSMRGCVAHVMTLDHALYLQGHSALT